jgi:drug/metabolite transporter (DMT)-like permease
VNESTTKIRYSPLLTLSAGAVCISFAGVFVKLLGMEKMGPTAIGFWRTLIGAAILFTWTALRNNRLSMPAPVMRWSALAGFIFFLDLFFWHRSILYAGVGMATMLANTQVFGTAILSYFVFKEKLTLKFFAAALCAIVGVCLLIGIGSNSELSARYMKGVALGLLTGLVYANYIVSLKTAGQKEKSLSFLTLMAWTSLFSALFLGTAGVLENDKLMPPDFESIGLLFALALVAQVLGWWAISSSLPKIDASRSGLALLLQPVLATVWGVLVFGEYLTLIQIAGALMTLTAIYIGSIRSK